MFRHPGRLFSKSLEICLSHQSIIFEEKNRTETELTKTEFYAGLF